MPTQTGRQLTQNKPEDLPWWFFIMLRFRVKSKQGLINSIYH
jgi:hypothetical protein